MLNDEGLTPEQQQIIDAAIEKALCDQAKEFIDEMAASIAGTAVGMLIEMDIRNQLRQIWLEEHAPRIQQTFLAGLNISPEIARQISDTFWQRLENRILATTFRTTAERLLILARQFDRTNNQGHE